MISTILVISRKGRASKMNVLKEIKHVHIRMASVYCYLTK